MDAFHVKTLEEDKGKGNLEMVMAGNLFIVGASGPSTAIGGGRKRKRRDTATTTRSPGGHRRSGLPTLTSALLS